MASRRQSSQNDKSSIRYWWIPVDVDSFESDVALTNGDIHLRSSSHAKSSKQPETKFSGNGVSTSLFVSTIASIWHCVGQPAVHQTRSKDGEICPNEDIICYSDSFSIDGENLSNDQTLGSRYPFSARSNFEDLKTFKKKLCFASCNRNIDNPILSCNTRSNVDFLRLNKVENIETAACNSQNNSTAEGDDFSGSQNVNLVRNVQQHPDSLCMTDSLRSQPVTSIKDQVLISADWALGQSRQSTDSRCIAAESSKEVSALKDHIVHKNCNSILCEVVDVEEHSTKCWLSMQDKLKLTFAKNKHALAGALAGTLVSLCLHPVDTVKTVIQANCAGQKSSYDILRTIISERGALGLYRGIASNITSSAPISAIYTYTYESVKCALLPILPKEYHSLAHCIAGGCSSIATSFVYTPSERIKQQMQVGSHYQNCWKALIGCLEKGGVPSLFSGWSAVLCRNIPHSIIKFYTYESLKQFLSKTSKPDAGLSTLQTLVCGGLAGSTAALFTTPFDVVKTRLQTQVPGSLAKYHGVLHVLQEVAREEGLQGLYRGLTPRLAMYVCQGAIFFASYEFLKAIFSLEPQRAPSRTVKNEEADDPVPSRLQKLNS